MKKFFSIPLMIAILGVPASYAGEIYNRRTEQQERIAQGVASGRLQPWETTRLERQEGRLNHEIARDRANHYGHLTGQEFRQINRQQNHLSNEIYRYKHN